MIGAVLRVAQKVQMVELKSSVAQGLGAAIDGQPGHPAQYAGLGKARRCGQAGRNTPGH